jgi:hypothetical protein
MLVIASDKSLQTSEALIPMLSKDVFKRCSAISDSSTPRFSKCMAESTITTL